MVEVAAACDAGVVVMHMLGDPATMQRAPRYDDVVREVGGFLLAQAAVLRGAGVKPSGSSSIRASASARTSSTTSLFCARSPSWPPYGYPVLIGASRKRFIGEITGEPEPRERLGGSVGAALEAVSRGASVVRVHDVGATVQAIAVTRAIHDS